MEGYIIHQIGEEVTLSVFENLLKIKEDFNNAPACEYPICLIELFLSSYYKASFVCFVENPAGDLILKFTV
jgi:hypothetical protein